jgi:hypothetical protein
VDILHLASFARLCAPEIKTEWIRPDESHCCRQD